MTYDIFRVENEEQLNTVLEFCYSLLGSHLKNVENYRYEDWRERLKNERELLLFAYKNNNVISAVLGRKESRDSLIAGFVACDERYRNMGITKRLMSEFYINAKNMGFKYITLGSDENATGFYEKCGYK